MMEYQLENEKIRLAVKSLGAELSSVINKENGSEYLWQGMPEYWNGQAPILFPIVGRLANDEYRIGGEKYSLPQHGFARRREFLLFDKGDNWLEFVLCDDEETLKVYPYKFSLKIRYTIEEAEIKVEYFVENKDSVTILFSIGAHPGFNCPLNKKLSFEDYYLQLNKPENAEIWKLSGPLFSGETEPFLCNEDKIALSHDLFANDALVFKGLEADKITLKTDKSSEYVSMTFTGFPDFAVWTKPKTDAPYICLEPWYGRADISDYQGEFADKYGVLKLESGKEFRCSYVLAIG